MNSDNDKVDSESFIRILTKIVTGLDSTCFDEKTRSDLEEKSWDYFADYIYRYILDKYGRKYAIQIKIAQNDNTIFDKFPDLTDKLDEAWKDFFKQYTV
jgi:hypothetical protein